ncbi:hypothetical protein HDE_13984 [Halotydeus destructor]|nr:hypothetical protein HDE_13984 [Halotydeus destructor]
MKLLIFVILVGFSSAMEPFWIREVKTRGDTEYLWLESQIDRVTKERCIEACLTYDATLIEPRSRAEEAFITWHFSYRTINVFFGMTNTSRFVTWRHSDGQPVENIRWDPSESCQRMVEGYVVYLLRDGWCTGGLHRALGCTCQRKRLDFRQTVDSV